MRRFLSWLIGLPVFILCMGFAVANRQWTQLSLDPFNEASPALALDLPLWLLLFVGIFIGVILGWFFCWRAQGKWRKLARDRQREITQLQGELHVAKNGAEKVVAQAMAPLPGILP